jgi:hypothetical protein
MCWPDADHSRAKGMLFKSKCLQNVAQAASRSQQRVVRICCGAWAAPQHGTATRNVNGCTGRRAGTESSVEASASPGKRRKQPPNAPPTVVTMVARAQLQRHRAAWIKPVIQTQHQI